MALKLAISDIVGVKVKGEMAQADGSKKPFNFVLQVDRLTNEEIRAHLADNEGKTSDFFLEHARGWKDQRFILQDDDTPAPFGPEALALLLTIPGLANVCWVAYLEQVGVAAKN